MQEYDSKQFSFHKIPSIDEYKLKLEQLKNLDLSTCTQQEIHSKFFEHAIFQPFVVSPFSKEEFNHKKIFRVRLNVNPEKENVYLHSTFSYPPSFFCNENGRANLKNRNVFYCSDFALTAILESKPKPGDSGILSIWKPVVDREVSISVFLPEDLIQNNSWHMEAKAIYEDMRSQMPHLNEENAEQLIILNSFTCNQFIDEKPPYSITSWLSNRILYSEFDIDGIMYPSFTTNSKFCNLALHPSFTDNYLRFEKAIQFSVEEISKNMFRTVIGLIGIPGKTNIKWQQPSYNDIEEFRAIIADSEWVVDTRAIM